MCGQFITEEVRLGVPQYDAHHCATNFNNLEEFVPERSLGAPEYKDDNRKERPPFFHGP
jgi:hypothetical protein